MWINQLRSIGCCLLLSSLSLMSSAQNAQNRGVILQGFWWDFSNDAYPMQWANYLTELAPRLRATGIDQVWIPVSVKNDAPGTGYVPFDHYDLGDKYQKGRLQTNLGDKDELLRLIAVLRANGMYVVQDVVLNHIGGAGSATATGGQDPEALDDGSTLRYKNFRYVSYKTPAYNEGGRTYLEREGRFPKNWQNFFPSPVNACCTDYQNTPYWGPDIDYAAGAYGESSNALYNPKQTDSYMRNMTRDWLIWYKKQCGIDGWRIDAVKHFPTEVQEDFLWNLRYNAGWASGGDQMFALGEYVDYNKAVLDQYVNNIQGRAGAFDFSLRWGLHQMVTGWGDFDIGSLPNWQQSNRQYTAPFLNSHDTYRPILDSLGRYADWETGRELAPHIEQTDPRWALAYAIILAVDGAPIVYFEDLFNVGYSGHRFNHRATDTTLKVNDDLMNLLWCRQNLRFMEGRYLVRWQANDALIIEREGKALICANDHWDTWQDPKGVQTAFADGTVLVDYSGAAGSARRVVYGGGKVDLSIPPCNGSASRRGYSIWAPEGITTNYSNSERSTTQEWEMADDLGDRHPQSLEQGGAIPWHSTQCRNVGKIFSAPNKPIEIEVFPADSTAELVLRILDTDCNPVDSITGVGGIKYRKNSGAGGWLSLQLRNSNNQQAGQKAWVKATYTAPQVVNTQNEDKKVCSCLDGEEAVLHQPDLVKPKEAIQLFPNPANEWVYITSPIDVKGVKVINPQGKMVLQNRPERKEHQLSLSGLRPGLYLISIETENGTSVHKVLKMP